MKIVINNCFGGFGLSPLALKKFAARKGKECFFFRHSFKENTYTPISLDDLTDHDVFWTAFSVPNPKDVLCDNTKWHEMSDEKRKESNAKYNSIYLNSRPDDRSDPDLIAVVEELGDTASGACAHLKIVEIPDDVKWEIDEYDGLETVREVHRSWS